MSNSKLSQGCPKLSKSCPQVVSGFAPKLLKSLEVFTKSQHYPKVVLLQMGGMRDGKEVQSSGGKY